jgi:hypothetical protein
MVWFWGVFATGLLVDITYQVLAFLALEKGYSDATSDVMSMVTADWVAFAAGNAATYALMAINYESWMTAENPEQDTESMFALFSL